LNYRANVLALSTVLIWGSTFAAISASLNGGYSAGHLVLVRYFIASIFFVLIAIFSKNKFKLPTFKDAIKILILGWIGISVYNIGVTYGQLTISAGTAGMLIGSAPIFTAIIAVVVLRERLSFAECLGLFIGFIGIILISLGTSKIGFIFSKGVIFVLISALAVSIFFVYQKQLLIRYKPIEITAYFTWAGTIPFFIFSPGIFDTLQNSTLEANLSAIYVGIFPAAIAYILWSTALSIGRASAVTSMIYLEPVVAVIVAWFWLRELPSTLSIIGGVVALSGVIFMNVMARLRYKTRELEVS